MPTIMPPQANLDIVVTHPGQPRLARLTFRGPLDVEDTVVIFAAALVKGVGAKLCAKEAEGELARITQGPRRGHDSNGVIVPGRG